MKKKKSTLVELFKCQRKSYKRGIIIVPQIYFFIFFGQNINVHTISLNTINQVLYVNSINMWKNYYRHYECNFCKGIFCSHKLQRRSISLKTGNKNTNSTQSTNSQLVNLTRLSRFWKKKYILWRFEKRETLLSFMQLSSSKLIFFFSF